MQSKRKDAIAACRGTKKGGCKPPEFWISFFGLLVLGTLFFAWCIKKPEVSLPGRAAAFVSAALYGGLCLRFVPEWMRFWRKGGTPSRCLERPEGPGHTTIKIFFLLLATDALVVLLAFAMRKATGYGGTFFQNLEFWRCTDSGHYLDIARDWYLSQGDWDRLVQLVFLPGYPVVVRLVDHLVHNVLYSGMLVSALSFSGAGCVLYRLLRLDLTHGAAVRTIKYLCLMPGAFFLAAPMSESLFLLLCVSSLYCARTGKWTLGCLFGGLAAFTRTLGLTLVVPLLFEWVRKLRTSGGGAGHKRRMGVQAASILLVPAGFAAYCGINMLVSGDPFKFLEYQSVHWGQNMGLFFNTAAYQMEQAIHSWSTDPHTLLGLWLPNLLACFASLILMFFAARTMRPSYTAWFLVYFAVAIGTTWLLSAPRYLAVLLPIPMAVSQLAKKPAADLLATLCCEALSLLYLFAFVMRWQVW